MKKLLKSLIPPIILGVIKKRPNYSFSGNYQTWQDAISDIGGYEDPNILEKVKNSLLKVKRGEAVHERDSVIFDKKEYSWPVLAGLLWVSSKKNLTLNVLDFGGSLGSSYFQNREFLEHLKNFRWNIVEQNKFVECGKQYFEDKNLKFFYTIEECLKSESPNVFLASSVIQCIEKPYELLEEILRFDFEYVIFDRTPFLKDTDRLTVQKVEASIFNGSIASWFINEKKFLEILAPKYKVIADFDSMMGEVNLKDVVAYEKGYIFQKK